MVPRVRLATILEDEQHLSGQHIPDMDAMNLCAGLREAHGELLKSMRGLKDVEAKLIALQVRIDGLQQLAKTVTKDDELQSVEKVHKQWGNESMQLRAWGLE